MTSNFAVALCCISLLRVGLSSAQLPSGGNELLYSPSAYGVGALGSASYPQQQQYSASLPIQHTTIVQPLFPQQQRMDNNNGLLLYSSNAVPTTATGYDPNAAYYQPAPQTGVSPWQQQIPTNAYALQQQQQPQLYVTANQQQPQQQLYQLPIMHYYSDGSIPTDLTARQLPISNDILVAQPQAQQFQQLQLPVPVNGGVPQYYYAPNNNDIEARNALALQQAAALQLQQQQPQFQLQQQQPAVFNSGNNNLNQQQQAQSMMQQNQQNQLQQIQQRQQLLQNQQAQQQQLQQQQQQQRQQAQSLIAMPQQNLQQLGQMLGGSSGGLGGLGGIGGGSMIAAPNTAGGGGGQPVIPQPGGAGGAPPMPKISGPETVMTGMLGPPPELRKFIELDDSFFSGMTAPAVGGSQSGAAPPTTSVVAEQPVVQPVPQRRQQVGNNLHAADLLVPLTAVPKRNVQDYLRRLPPMTTTATPIEMVDSPVDVVTATVEPPPLVDSATSDSNNSTTVRVRRSIRERLHS